MNDIKAICISQSFYFKVIAAALCAFCVIIYSAASPKFANPEGFDNLIYYETMVVATGGYLLILLCLVVIYLVDSTQHLFEIILLLVGAVLNVIAGLMAIYVAIKYDGNYVSLGSGAMMMGIAAILIFDGIREMKLGSDDNTETRLIRRLQSSKEIRALHNQVPNAIKVDNRESYYDVPKKVVVMSAEVENSKEEETKEQPKSYKQKFLTHWQIGAKILELLICVGCLGFIFEPVNETHIGGNYLHHTGIMYTAYTGFMLINLILLLGRAIGDRIPFPTIILFDLNGAALFLITAILLFVDRIRLAKDIFHPKQYVLTMMTISICLAFANTILFIVEAFFTFRRRQDL